MTIFHERAIVAADEEPVSTPEDLPAVQLADAIRQRQLPVVEEATKPMR
jgi:hypothetical protein